MGGGGWGWHHVEQQMKLDFPLTLMGQFRVMRFLDISIKADVVRPATRDLNVTILSKKSLKNATLFENMKKNVTISVFIGLFFSQNRFISKILKSSICDINWYKSICPKTANQTSA